MTATPAECQTIHRSFQQQSEEIADSVDRYAFSVILRSRLESVHSANCTGQPPTLEFENHCQSGAVTDGSAPGDGEAGLPTRSV